MTAMEPRIQYATTSDGVNIAYTTVGEGTPLVRATRLRWSDIHLQLQNPQFQAWLNALSSQRLVLYDGRNSGLSAKSEDYSLDTLIRDLEAVVDAIGLDRFALYGGRFEGPTAITYATRHPERVSHLILFCSSPDVASATSTEFQTLEQLAHDDWELYVRTVIQVAFDWEGGELPEASTDAFRQAFTADEWLAVIEATRAFDATPLLEHVACPTLVLHRRDVKTPPLETAQRMAARIPHAQLVLLEGSSSVSILGDIDAAPRAINEFLADGQETSPQEAPTTDQVADTHTILFTDMQASTALTERLGDAAAQEVRRAHNEIVRLALSASGGSEIKHTGDGIMASFATASSALDCAIAIQRGVAAHKENQPDSPLGVYVGLNAGEPIAEDDPDGRVDLFGTSVNLAKRICDHAEPGQIVAADVVRQLAAGKQFLFSDLGETELRGFEDPVKLWELRWQAEGSP